MYGMENVKKKGVIEFWVWIEYYRTLSQELKCRGYNEQGINK